MRPNRRHLILAVAILLGFACGFAVFTLPARIAAQLRTALVERSAREGIDLQLSGVYVQLLDGVTLDGVVLRDKGAPTSPPFAQLPRVHIDYEINGLFRPRISLRRIELVSPRGHVVRFADGRTNLDPVLKRLNRERKGSGDAGEATGWRKYVSNHLPDVSVRDLHLAIDDASGPEPLSLAGIDLRHLRLQGAAFELRNVSDVEESPSLQVSGSTTVLGIAQPIRIDGDLQMAKRTGSVTMRLPADLAVTLGGWRVQVGSVSLSADGHFRLGQVNVSRQGASGSLALRVREIAATFSPTAAPATSATPSPLLLRLPPSVRSALSHVTELTLDEPVIVSNRETPSLVPELEDDDETPVDAEGAKGRKPAAKPKTRASVGSTKGAIDKAKDAGTVPNFRRDADAGDGHIVRENLARLFATGADRLDGKVAELRQLVAAIPIPVVTIRHGRASYSDERTAGSSSELSDFNARVERKPGSEIVSLQVDFNVPGRKVANSVAGRIDVATGDAELRVHLEYLPLAPYAAVLPASLGFEATSAVQNATATLLYNAAQSRFTIDGDGTAADFSILSRRIARQKLQHVTVQAKGRLDLGLKEQRVELADGEIVVGKVHALITSSIKRFRTAPAFDLRIRIPSVPCQDVVASVPVGFAPLLDGMKCDGHVSFEVNSALDTANMNSLKFDFDAALGDTRITDTGKYIRFEVFQAPFEHHARQKDGTLFTFVTGPGSDRWEPITSISPYFVQVLTTTEDGGFFWHNGFLLDAIRSSMIENLKRGRFVRGGSTITMQLVKNLFFVEREKTISRKVQEAVIVWQIEKTLTKEQILELYLNIIEYGPKIYGIRPAVQHYFEKSPSELTLLQAIWMGSIIPNPRAFYHQFRDGAVSEAWATYLCWIGSTMLTREKISQEQFDAMGDCSGVFSGTAEDPGTTPEGELPAGEGAIAPTESAEPDAPPPPPIQAEEPPAEDENP